MKKSLTVLIITAALALTACTGSPDESKSPASVEPGSGSGLVITDAWVKAADEGMTAAFGVIENTTDAAVTLVGATTEASPMVELHETVATDSGSTMMQEVDGGFVIEPGEALTLEPGGNHLMFMAVPSPLMPGDDVSIVLELSDGATVDFDAVVKEFSGAQEEYMPDMDMDGEMEMSPSASADAS